VIDTPIMVASVNGGRTVLKNYPVNLFITVPCLCKQAVSNGSGKKGVSYNGMLYDVTALLSIMLQYNIAGMGKCKNRSNCSFRRPLPNIGIFGVPISGAL